MKEYNFGLNWSGNVKEDFVAYLQGACKKKKLSFIWISDGNINDIIKKIETNQLHIQVLLDTEATYYKPGDVYSRLCFAVKDASGTVINDPNRADAATDKAFMHYELSSRGFTVPYTVVVRKWESQKFRLSDEEKKNLTPPFIIKPAHGYGQLGVARGVRGTINEIAQARKFDPNDHFLLQEKITPVQLSGKRAWFRLINVFDTIIPCWWDDQVHFYEHLSYADFKKHRLYPLVKIVSKIAALTGMVWFSTEVAIDKKCGNRRFVVIDYLNDQCDMTTQNENKKGVPDKVVRYTADSIVKAAYKWIKNDKARKNYSILFKDAHLRKAKLGSPPILLR
jgi:hypothetical protein